MKLDDLLRSPSEWVKAEGPNSKIVMSSRVRLARNIRDHPFPGWAKKTERQKLLELIQPVVEGLPEMADHFGDSMDNITAAASTRPRMSAAASSSTTARRSA
jgi:protein arginine kinase